MTFTRTWKIIVGVAIIIGAIAGVLAIADDWDKVERFLDWFYPLPLLILLSVALVVMSSLYVREHQRKKPKTYGELSFETRERTEAEERREAQAQQKERERAEARRTITLISNEVTENGRLAKKALGRGQLIRSFETENWVAHRHALAEIAGSQDACAAVAAAYGVFADLDRRPAIGEFPSRIDDRDLGEAIKKAQTAAFELDDLAEIIEARRIQTNP